MKKNPISSNAAPARNSATRPLSASPAAISGIYMVPVEPYIKAIPYRKKPVAKAPSKKYLRALSALPSLSRNNPAITYSATDIVSSPMNAAAIWFAEPRTIIPTVANKISV